MRINLDESSFISLKTDNKEAVLSVKTKDEEEKTLVVSVRLDLKRVDEIIARLVTMKKDLV